MKSKVAKMIREALIGIGTKLGVETLLHNIRREGVDLAVKTVKKKLTEENRAEFITFVMIDLAAYDKIASEAIRRHQREWNEKTEGDDRFVMLLSKLYIALSDNEQEKAVRLEMFKILGNMNDEEFNAILDALDHDVVMRWVRMIPKVTERTIMEFKAMVQWLGASEELHKLDAYTAEKLDKTIESLDSKGIYERTWYGKRKYPKHSSR